MADKCEKCGKDMEVLDETDDYRLLSCKSRHQFHLEVSEKLLSLELTFHVAANKPWPEGRWVRIEEGSAGDEDAGQGQLAELP